MSGIIGGAGSKSGVIGETEIDYEEGTWTPYFYASVNFGHSTQVGTYVKIGKFVQCQFDCIVNSTTSTSGGVNLQGLPFTAKNSGARSGMVVAYSDGFADTAAPQGGYLVQNTTTISVMTRSSTDGRGRMIAYVQASAFSGNERVIGHINYIAA
jgi:hypothetical protein